MKRTRRTIAMFSSLASLLCLLQLSPALAGPAEDYSEGSKHYESGDLITALPPLRKAADAGHASAQALLAEILQQADSGPEAIAYFRKAAVQGNADGQFGLGSMLAAGEGEDKNLGEALKWITKAAEQGHKLAINELALAYITGQLGVTEKQQQSADALRWINIAAENGYITAMEKLASAYRNGELGLAVDLKLADQWTETTRKALGLKKERRRNRSSDK